jgi:hypothetical protein
MPIAKLASGEPASGFTDRISYAYEPPTMLPVATNASPPVGLNVWRSVAG